MFLWTERKENCWWEKKNSWELKNFIGCLAFYSLASNSSSIWLSTIKSIILLVDIHTKLWKALEQNKKRDVLRGVFNSAMQPKKHNNSPQSKTIRLLVDKEDQSCSNPSLDWALLGPLDTPSGVEGAFGPTMWQVCIAYTILKRECPLEQTNKQTVLLV